MDDAWLEEFIGCLLLVLLAAEGKYLREKLFEVHEAWELAEELLRRMKARHWRQE